MHLWQNRGENTLSTLLFYSTVSSGHKERNKATRKTEYTYHGQRRNGPSEAAAGVEPRVGGLRRVVELLTLPPHSVVLIANGKLRVQRARCTHRGSYTTVAWYTTAVH